MDIRLKNAKHIDGRSRFYEPGKHPALFKYNEALKKLYESGATDDNEYVIYIKQQIAMFEGGESEAKIYYLLRYFE